MSTSLRYPVPMPRSPVEKRLLIRLSISLLFFAALIAPPLFAQSAPANAESGRQKPLLVGIKLAPPFVMEKDGVYSGLAIDLWEQAAKQYHWRFEYRQLPLDDLLSAVGKAEIDVGLGAITTTAERESRMDFAHPIISSGLGVAVRNNQRSGWMAVAKALISPAFLKIIGALFLLLLLVGTGAWLLERKPNPEHFGGPHRQGIFAGLWWATVTMTTVGYGDLAPRSVPGRILGMVWMLSALLIVSFFTASITSALTVGQLSQQISTAEDLNSARIASVAGTTSAIWLDRRDMDYQKAADLDAALNALNKGNVDAVVYDAPLLRWEIRQRFRRSLQILPLVLERQDYAFALPDNSALREQIDASLLDAINAPDWQARVAEYLGEPD